MRINPYGRIYKAKKKLWCIPFPDGVFIICHFLFRHHDDDDNDFEKTIGDGWPALVALAIVRTLSNSDRIWKRVRVPPWLFEPTSLNLAVGRFTFDRGLVLTEGNYHELERYHDFAVEIIYFMNTWFLQQNHDNALNHDNSFQWEQALSGSCFEWISVCELRFDSSGHPSSDRQTYRQTDRQTDRHT